ncbi:MAG TPA: energy transducer TonB [Candidatus Solibacter sp.]|nr:energy transducer TonB [Candidatus Solibacter sp.]
MSAIRQFRIPESDANSPAYLDASKPEPAPAPENPLQLLRDAIAQLKSPTGALPDQQQVANLLAEAREALEHANVIASAVSRSDAHLIQAEFEQALDSLDQGLATYPNDPILIARRSAVEEQQSAFQSAAAVRDAMQEAQWLLEHDRTDLAAQFLKEKAAELPDQEELAARLGELQALLPEWEQRRHAQDALARAQTLEQLQQWRAALTVIEEALQPYPSNTILHEAAERIRVRLADHERHKKLARRMELIKQQIGARAWRQALTLLENTQIEFPGAGDLKHLRREITVGLRRSEVEEAVADVRKCVADGELEQAQRVLQRALDGLQGEPALEALSKELETEKHYRDSLRNAQVLFGRGQLDQAESVLTQLLDQDRPEAQALLAAIRAARQAAEETHLLERGREKALALSQQHQYGQAVDLLRNLLSLFPGNPILERDLAIAQTGLEQIAAPAVPASQPEEAVEGVPEELHPPAPRAVDSAAASAVVSTPGRFRRVAIAGAATILLAWAGAAAWKLSRRTPPARVPTATSPTAATPAPTTIAADPRTAEPTVAPSNIVQPPPLTAAPQPAAAAASSRESKSKAKPAPPLPAFVSPNSTPLTARQNVALPLPPTTDPSISITTTPGLPITLNTEVSAPAPPPTPAETPAPSPAPAAAKPALPPGGQLIQAQLIKRTNPEYPSLARQRALFGTVRLTATIDEHGDIKNVKVLSGDVLLAASARDAVKLWKYKPAILNGRPVATSTEIQIVFGEKK